MQPICGRSVPCAWSPCEPVSGSVLGRGVSLVRRRSALPRLPIVQVWAAFRRAFCIQLSPL